MCKRVGAIDFIFHNNHSRLSDKYTNKASQEWDLSIVEWLIEDWPLQHEQEEMLHAVTEDINHNELEL